MGLNEDCGVPAGPYCLAVKQRIDAVRSHNHVIHPGHEFVPFWLGAVSIVAVADFFASIGQAPAFVG